MGLRSMSLSSLVQIIRFSPPHFSIATAGQTCKLFGLEEVCALRASLAISYTLLLRRTD